MPYKSAAQERWAHTAEGTKALGGSSAVHEWDQASKGRKLPEKVMSGNKGYMGKTESFAAGGPVLGRARDFLKTPDRFTGVKNGPLKDSSTEDNFGKSGGKDMAPPAKGKCLPPVKPQASK